MFSGSAVDQGEAMTRPNPFYYMDYPEREWYLYTRELHFYDAHGDLDYIAYDEFDHGVREAYELYE